MNELGQILKRVEENRGPMQQMLKDLVGIPSVAGPPKGDAPFGQAVQDALVFMLDKGREAGFSVRNTDNYGGDITFPGEPGNPKDAGPTKTVGIACHLDVVPEGTGWSHPPFGGETQEGRMYGRGTLDNKGPTIAAFFAMKAIKECGIKPVSNIRMVLGLDEETGWEGMKYYLGKVEAPDLGFTPDAEFPVIHAEKGILVFDLAKKFGRQSGGRLTLRSLKGGTAANMVAASARAIVLAANKEVYREIKEKAADFRESGKGRIHTKVIGKSLELTATGVSAHGARPETGENAISMMMAFLGEISFDREDVNDFIDFYNKHIGFELNGSSLGAAMSDDVSGDLVLNVGMVELNAKAARLTVNVRYPVTCTDEKVYDAMLPVLGKYQMGIVKSLHHNPLYVPLDDPFLKTLVEVYRTHTGDLETEPLVIGGGTYARAMDHFVAYGPSLPGQRDVAHQKDEYIDLDQLLTSAKIYAEVLYRVACRP